MNRRGLISGMGALFVCAPAIIRVSSLMPISVQPPPRRIAFDYIPPDTLVPLFYWDEKLEVERDEVDPHRVNVFIKPEYVDQFRIMADLIEDYLELVG